MTQSEGNGVATRADGAQENGGTAILETQSVSCAFGSVRAVDDVSFVVPRRGITGLIGPNGAGKTSMVGALCGTVRPTSGRVLFDGKDVTNLPTHLRARAGLIRIFQLSSEFGRLTVLENLLVAGQQQKGERFFTTLCGGRRRWGPREDELLDASWALLRRFGLEGKANDDAQTLSGGQKRVLELMRALMAAPKLLVLDEPLAGVNPALAQDIIGHLEALRDGGLPMLLIEHELDVVERLCEHVVAMGMGKVIAEGTMQALRRAREVQDAYSFG